MNIRRMVFCVLLAIPAFGLADAQTKMSKDEWQQQMNDYTKQRDDLRQQLDALNKDVDNLKQQIASLDNQIQMTKDATLALVGATAEMRRDFDQKLSALESTVDGLTRMSDADLAMHKEDVTNAQEQKDALQRQKIAALADFHKRLVAIQDKLNSLKSQIAQASIESAHVTIYVVKTWARDRDCLWNIAKKPSIYDNAFLWPKIYQANKDQIKDPNLIYPHQRLKIPPAGPMAAKTREGARRSKTLAHRRRK